MKDGTLYLSVGISGSGKSHFAESFCQKHDCVEVNADNIRKEFGDISDQSKNAEVWKKVASDINEMLDSGVNVFASNTNLNFKRIMDDYVMRYPNHKVVIFILKDSFDIELCWSRIRKDIDSGKSRSDVPRTVLENQFTQFKITYNKLKSMTPMENVEVYEV